MNLMPRPPLVGEVASSVSDDDGEVQPPAAAPGGKPLSHGLRRDSSPSRGALGRPSHFRWFALRYCLLCWRNVISALRQMMLLERQRSDRKMNLMPRPPLLGEVASSVSEDDGEVVHSTA